ncbi:pantothenate transporter [Penicillium riverlandense]|uniref:pantothenate transporter n=1 Tax=Penicillium riverlandense TaxID=1903569 RepID=UPI002547BAA9|nr:pantothenate transporter [Penicillium riverlandense]KAJ5825566.1 pantothenate transporter [Penicillium riverlandense]
MTEKHSEAAVARVEKPKDSPPDQNQDDSMQIFASSGDLFEYSADEARVVRWKLDLILLPMMAITYILSFMDKVALGESSIFGNFGRRSATNSFAGLSVCRFFLGAFETCITPILTILVSQYWTRGEQPLRASIWWAGGGVGGFIADSITYAVSGGAWKGSQYATWQVVFLVFGPISIAWGVFLFFFLPTSPMSAWFLTERERKISVMRVARNHTGIENRKYKLYQVKEALLDIQVWMLCAQSFLQCIPGGGLTAFGKIVLQGLGYSDRETVVMGMPANGIQLLINVLAGVISQVIPNTRCMMMILANIIVLIGSVLIEILYVNTIPYIMCMSLISSNIGGFTKKATCAVMMFISYAVGQIVAPQFFIDSEAPTYPTGFRAFYVSVALMIVIELLMVLYLARENRKKARSVPSESQAPSGVSSADFQDLTDKEHPHFRYVY